MKIESKIGKLKGKMGDLVIYELHGELVARRRPYYSKRKLDTPVRRRNTCLMGMINRHITFHGITIDQIFDGEEKRTPRNMYYHINAKALAEALGAIADDYANKIYQYDHKSIETIEQAIADYATANPDRIVLVHKEAMQPATLQGAWPESISMMHKKNRSITMVPCMEMSDVVNLSANYTFSKVQHSDKDLHFPSKTATKQE